MASKDSPYSTGFMSANINFDNDTEQMFKQIKREEDETHESIPTLPYELSSLPQYFADIVDNAMNASIKIENVLKSKNFKNKKDLEKLKNNVDKMIKYLIRNVDPTLDKFAIRGRLDSNDED
jgi:hypothetical protein